MKISKVSLSGARLLELEPHADERGFFARAWCREEFDAAGIDGSFVQASLSHTYRKGSIRGMHFQRPPSNEAKLVRCIRGAIQDVIVDLRPDTPTFLDHYSIELSASNRLALYIPHGFAHGFQTLVDDVEVFYEMTDVHRPDLAGGLRFDDPALGIEWPLQVTVIGDRDATYPDMDASAFASF